MGKTYKDKFKKYKKISRKEQLEETSDDFQNRFGTKVIPNKKKKKKKYDILKEIDDILVA